MILWRQGHLPPSKDGSIGNAGGRRRTLEKQYSELWSENSLNGFSYVLRGTQEHLSYLCGRQNVEELTSDLNVTIITTDAFRTSRGMPKGLESVSQGTGIGATMM